MVEISIRLQDPLGRDDLVRPHDEQHAVDVEARSTCVRMLSSVCLAKNVLVKPARSWIGLLVASAHQLVNSKVLEVLRRARLPPAARRGADAGGVGVVLRERAVADHEELHVLEQAGAGPEAVALVAVDLVEGLADVHAAALELDVHHRQAVDEDRHVVAVRRGRAALALRDLVLVDDLQPVVVDVLLVDQVDVLDGAVVALREPGRGPPGCAPSSRRCPRWRRRSSA